MSEIAQIHHHARVAFRDGLSLDDAIARCAEHFPDAEHDQIRQLTRNAYNANSADLPPEDGRECVCGRRLREGERLCIACGHEEHLLGLPDVLHEPLLMVLQAPVGTHRVRLEALGESDAWRSASPAVRVDTVGRILRRLRDDDAVPPKLRGAVSPDLLTATLGAMDRRTGRWRLPAHSPGAERGQMMKWLSDVAQESKTAGSTPTPVLRGLAWPGRLTLIHAREKRGKSTLARFAVAALSRGRDWLDAPTVDGGARALLVSEEHREDVTRMMMQPGVDADLSRIAIAPAVSIAHVRAMLDAESFHVVLIDTLTAFAAANGIRDLHGAGDLAVLLADLAAAAKEHDCAVIAAHHNRKNQIGDGDTEYRDSTAIGAAADMIVSMEDVEHAERSRRLVLRGRWDEPALTVTLGPSGYEIDAEDELAAPPRSTSSRPTVQRILLHVQRFQAEAGPDKRLPARTIAGALDMGGRRFAECRDALGNLTDDGLLDHVDAVEGVKRNDASKRQMLGYGLTDCGRKLAAELAAAPSCVSASLTRGGANPETQLDPPGNTDDSCVSAHGNATAPETQLGNATRGAKVDDELRRMITDSALPMDRDAAPSALRLLIDKRSAGGSLTATEVDQLAAWAERRADELIASGEVPEDDGDAFNREVANGKTVIVESYSPPEGADPHRPTCPEDAQAWLRLHGSYVEGRGPIETAPDCHIGKADARLYRRDRAIILEDALGQMRVGPRALRWAGMPEEMIAALVGGHELQRGEYGEWRDVADPSRQYTPVGDETIQ